MLLAARASMGMPLSSRTWSTPTWAMPKAAPPPTARPTLAPRIFRASRCSGGDGGDRRLARTCSARATGSRSRRAGSSGITNGSQWLIGRACDAPLCRLTTSKILRRAGAARVDTRPGASTTSTTTSDTSLAARTQGSAIPPRSNTRNAKRSPSVVMSLVTLSAWLCSSPFALTLARRRAAWPSAPSTPRTRSGDMRESRRGQRPPPEPRAAGDGDRGGAPLRDLAAGHGGQPLAEQPREVLEHPGVREQKALEGRSVEREQAGAPRDGHGRRARPAVQQRHLAEHLSRAKPVDHAAVAAQDVELATQHDEQGVALLALAAHRVAALVGELDEESRQLLDLLAADDAEERNGRQGLHPLARRVRRGPLGLDPSARPITETWSGGGHCSAA